MEKTINDYIKALQYSKVMEEYYRNDRIKQEKAIIKAIDTDTRLEGSKTYGIDRIKVKIIKKMSYSLDFEAYEAMHFLPEFQFVKMKPAIDLKKLKEVEEDFKKEVAECITKKPAKTAVTIEKII